MWYFSFICSSPRFDWTSPFFHTDPKSHLKNSSYSLLALARIPNWLFWVIIKPRLQKKLETSCLRSDSPRHSLGICHWADSVSLCPCTHRLCFVSLSGSLSQSRLLWTSWPHPMPRFTTPSWEYSSFQTKMICSELDDGYNQIRGPLVLLLDIWDTE